MSSSSQPFYESEKAISEYLLFHYGSSQEQCPHPEGPSEALHYPERCVSQCLQKELLGDHPRALDLGCAVGRSTFELARHCHEVVGIDYSHGFIEHANKLRNEGSLPYRFAVEGNLTQDTIAKVPDEIDRDRVRFLQGDAMHLPEDLGVFDVVLMANLIDRLDDPIACLNQLSGLLKSGGQLIITSPYTWLEAYTPSTHWLGGLQRDGEDVQTLDGLHDHLSPAFQWTQTLELPFLIREHARKYQWSVAQGSCWVRR